MKKSELMEKLTQDISRNAYRAYIQDHLKDIGYDASMMEYHANTENGKAFEAMELLNLLTNSEKGDGIYREAERDAAGTVKEIEDRFGRGSAAAIIALLDQAGFDGKAYYAVNAE